MDVKQKFMEAKVHEMAHDGMERCKIIGMAAERPFQPFCTFPYHHIYVHLTPICFKYRSQNFLYMRPRLKLLGGITPITPIFGVKMQINGRYRAIIVCRRQKLCRMGGETLF